MEPFVAAQRPVVAGTPIVSAIPVQALGGTPAESGETGFIGAGDVMHPAGNHQTKPSRHPSRSEIVAQRAENALRQFLTAIHGDLPGAVLYRCVAVA